LQFEDDSLKTATVMKTHPISVCLALAAIIALIVAACAINQKHAPGVSIRKTSVEVYPGTKISADDQKALDAVLKNFNKSLYKIRTYDRGRLVKTRGSLADVRIDQKLLAEISMASKEGVSYYASQFGYYNYDNVAHAYVHAQGVPTPFPLEWTKLPPPPTTELRNSERLVSRVAPILQKYSNQPALQ
jgi:hypothetical protein